MLIIITVYGNSQVSAGKPIDLNLFFPAQEEHKFIFPQGGHILMTFES